MKNFFRIAIVITVTAQYAAAQDSRKVYEPASRPHSAREVLADFSIAYVVLWAGFAATQPEAVADATWAEFYENVFEKGAVLLDNSNPYINYIGHPYVGSEYYLYFRSRGYAPKWAMLNMLITSTMFEIAIETFSEPFSVQDFVITPLVGGPIGWLREKEGLRLVNSDSKTLHVIGHILYLETNFWFFERASIDPAVSFDPGFAGIFFNAKF